MVDDLAEDVAGGCLEWILELFLAGTGYLILWPFGRRRGDGFLVSLLAYFLGVAFWVGVGFLAYWLLTRG